MKKLRLTFKSTLRPIVLSIAILILCMGGTSCGNRSSESTEKQKDQLLSDSYYDVNEIDDSHQVTTILISPKEPRPGEVFRVMAVGGTNIRKGQLEVQGATGNLDPRKSRSGNGLPFWRIDEYVAPTAGNYQVSFVFENKKVANHQFTITAKPSASASKSIWQTELSWSAETEAFYAAWVNSLFYEADESTSWKALHEVMYNKDQNFLYNHLGLNEDNPTEKIRVLMQPDCADNPFYMRAYFAWKMGLPFGYHECDRGSLGRPPKAGRWVTNDTPSSKAQPVLAFNSFIRKVMDGVHSGTARTALNEENTDYYPVALNRKSLRPGTVFADPYGHTLTIVRWIPQTPGHPGTLLSVDAQPDGTVAIKRFWKGNFLFSTTEVIGEPGFKAFRPIRTIKGHTDLVSNSELTDKSGFTNFALEQKGMSSETFYHTMDRIINPKPLDPESALLDLIQALYEQLLVRINSVSVGENYMKTHPGVIIPMPAKVTGVFQAGGQWEDFSTPNRDLRLLIAIDAILDFPERVRKNPEDFEKATLQSPEKLQKNLETILSKKLEELTITYVRSNETSQTLTLTEVLNRRDAFEMGYNPNDGPEIRWGAPENSEERSTCKRHVPNNQLETMRSTRGWFKKRLHPPT
jgi:hypothetical protein